MVLKETVPQQRDIILRGNNARVQLCTDKEALLWGAAGTGKSIAGAWKVHTFAESNPGAEILVVRKVRKALVKSFQLMFEDEILGPHHESLRHKIQWGERDLYSYDNGSHVWLGGMDNWEKHKSAKFSFVLAQEATELTEDEWQTLHRGLRQFTGPRGNRIPYRQLLGETNPKQKTHFLYARMFDTGVCTSMETTHKDNPAYWNAEKQEWTPDGAEYRERLASIMGPEGMRLFLGQWCNAEGLIFPEYRESDHLIERSALPRIIYTWASMDWGYSNPSCVLVLGAGADDKLYLLHQSYMSGLLIDEWAPIICDLRAKYGFRQIAHDPSMPSNIETINRAFSRLGRTQSCIKANNSWEAGVDAIHWALARDKDGVPNMRVVRDSLALTDHKRRAKHQPTCLQEELALYAYETNPKDGGDPGSDSRDNPAKRQEDHAIDALRYVLLLALDKAFAYKKIRTPDPWPPGSLGALLRLPLDFNGMLRKIA